MRTPVTNRNVAKSPNAKVLQGNWELFSRVMAKLLSESSYHQGTTGHVVSPFPVILGGGKKKKDAVRLRCYHCEIEIKAEL